MSHYSTDTKLIDSNGISFGISQNSGVIDVAIVGKQIAEVKIDASTADVIGYSVPEGEG